MTEFFSNPVVWVVISVVVLALVGGFVWAAVKFYVLFLEILMDAFLGKHD
jgi:hypothetical protein